MIIIKGSLKILEILKIERRKNGSEYMGKKGNPILFYNDIFKKSTDF